MKSLVAEAIVPPFLSFQGRYSIAFLGAFHGNMYYNGDAIMWFIENVWPVIREDLESAPLFIGGIVHIIQAALIPLLYALFCFLISIYWIMLGSEPPAALTARHSPYRDNIYIRGHVNDLDAFHDVARVFVTPHQYGAHYRSPKWTRLAYSSCRPVSS
jgi:hypothetical protein